MRHLIQICNLATGSKVVSWTGALKEQVGRKYVRNDCAVRAGRGAGVGYLRRLSRTRPLTPSLSYKFG